MAKTKRNIEKLSYKNFDGFYKNINDYFKKWYEYYSNKQKNITDFIFFFYRRKQGKFYGVFKPVINKFNCSNSSSWL